MERIKMLLTLVRSRNFAFKATKQEYHRKIRDKALKQLRTEIRAYSIIVDNANRADKTIEYKLKLVA